MIMDVDVDRQLDAQRRVVEAEIRYYPGQGGVCGRTEECAPRKRQPSWAIQSCISSTALFQSSKNKSP
jgi:hypothetical protein